MIYTIRKRVCLCRTNTNYFSLSSSIILGSLVNQQPILADQIQAEKIILKALESTDLHHRTSAEIQTQLLDTKPSLILKNISVKDIKTVKVSVFTKADESDKHIYTASLEKDGSYKVELDQVFHSLASGSQFTAKVTIERAQNVTDFMSPYQFNWTIETPDTAATITTENSSEETETSSTTPISSVSTTPTNPETSHSSNISNTETGTSATNENSAITTATSTQNNSVSATRSREAITELSNSSTEEKAITDNETTDPTTEEIVVFGEKPLARHATSGAIETTGTLKIIKNEASGSFEVIISNADTPEGIEEVKVPVWSANGGQDDIQWYTAKKELDNTYRAVISISNHKNDLGEYYIHLYYLDRKKKMVGVGGTTTTISKTATQPTGNLNITNVNAVTGAFDIVVSNVYAPNGLTEILVPVWSETNGQDDIQWYRANKQTDGTYTVKVSPSNHKNSLGTYHAHLYYRENSGQMRVVAGTTVNVTQAPVSGKITIANNNSVTGTFDVIVSQVDSSTGIKEVLVPVWGDKDGQNDIHWYSATRQIDGTYRVSVKASDHKFETGTYHAHVYYKTGDNQTKILGGTKVDVQTKQAATTISVANQNKETGHFDIVISNISPTLDVKEVLVPTWSETDGQDDIQWYSATRQSDGSYKVSISISNHKFNTGTYHSHVYYKTSDGQTKILGGTSLVVEASAKKPEATNISFEKTTTGFNVILNNVTAPAGLSHILVPVWSEAGGQDDIQWYTAQSLGNGKYQVAVDVQNHKNTSGLYHAHAYYKLTNGQTVGLGGSTIEIAASSSSLPNTNSASSNMAVNYQGTGLYTVTLGNVSIPGNVNVAVWSDAGGQDDIRWYRATPLGNGQYNLNFNVQNHSNTGSYHVHAYLNANGKDTFLSATTVNVARTNYDAPYYSQSDSRWGGINYGGFSMSFSGCVPTVIAMAASGIKGTTITPNQVAHYLYNSTTEFNYRGEAGTSAKGLVQAANQFGLKATALHGQDAIITAL